jgi:hypothetical protein
VRKPVAKMDLRMPPLPTLRWRDVVPHCNDVNVRVGRRQIILAKMSRTLTGFQCAATCRELTPPFSINVQSHVLAKQLLISMHEFLVSTA